MIITIEHKMQFKTRTLNGMTTANMTFFGLIQQKLSSRLKKPRSAKKAIMQVRIGAPETSLIQFKAQ